MARSGRGPPAPPGPPGTDAAPPRPADAKALALGGRLRREPDRLCGARGGRPGVDDVLGGVGPPAAPALGAHPTRISGIASGGAHGGPVRGSPREERRIRPRAWRRLADRVHVSKRRGWLHLDSKGGGDARERRGKDRKANELDPRTWRGRSIGWLSPALHELEVVGRGRNLPRRPIGCLEPRLRDQRSAAVERADDLGGRQAARAGAGHVPGLDTIHFEDESRLNFTVETQRSHHEGIPLIARSDYEAPFGRFSGALNGLPVDSALGVMESHDAVW
jgi:hypothetical protein